jgi:biotin carboxylase
VTRVLLLLPTTSYRIPDFLAAASRLGVDVTVASEEPSTLESLNPDGLLTLDFGDLAGSCERVALFARERPVAAVVGVDERTAVAAAAISERLGLPHDPVDAVAAAGNKAALRRRLALAGLPGPWHRLFDLGEDPSSLAPSVAYPCVLKPTFLSASRGVIRADDPASFVAAWRRLAAILARPDVAARGGAAAREVLVEGFLPGTEVALEGMLTEGRLRVLALFDKPDPLDGPYFEETIYLTPSRLELEIQRRVADAARGGAAAVGLRNGPIHAELRIHEGQARLIEIAARSIGGLCSRTLRFGTGRTLEELILARALGRSDLACDRESAAAGVMMIPIPSGGILDRIDGFEAAREIPGIVDVTITARPGQTLVPLPEGDRYLGFLFARGESPEFVERALRASHAQLSFTLR